MAETVDDITMNYFENDQQLVKELDKVILTKGAWSTILFKYQDWDRKKNDFGPVKFSVRRYQKREGTYRPKSKFNISSVDQAQKLIDGLNKWIQEGEGDAD
ncbi:MAG: hypothetical protein GC149_03885 [Gammaproteobacteria bacterium]|nr:hypothetical protein [Gammaproteobacteria bacterium]